MTAVVKQDSNFTGLSYSVETSQGVLPDSPVWFQLEPNSYSSFGANIKTVARKPINASRQLKKGSVVDLDSVGGFETDITATNLQDLSQTIFFAALRTKSELTAVGANVSHDYVPASGGTAYIPNDLLFAKNFTVTANNGLKLVTGVPTATTVPVTDTGVTTESDNLGTISRVGIQFGSGLVAIANSGTAYPTLTVTNTAATAALTSSANYNNTETITIGGKLYTLQSALTNVDGNIKIGASETATIANIHHAINGTGGTPGTDYAAATTPNTSVTATDDGSHVVTVTAIPVGDAGNVVGVTTTAADAVWNHATLTGGSGRDLTTLGVVDGEWVFIGDDAAGDQFATAANNGFARVRAQTATTWTFDRTNQEMVTDSGTGKTVRVFFGRVIRNESNPALIVPRTVQLERSLGYVDTSTPTQVQGEYVLGALPDTTVLTVKAGDKITAQIDFMGTTYQTVTASTGLKSGTRPALVDADAFNATSDVARFSLSVANTTDGNPTPLFAFLTDIKLTIKNNIKTNKAVSVLGGFSTTAGFFEISADVSAYFTSVTAIQQMIASAGVNVDLHFVKAQRGLSIDIPLVVLGKGMADVKINEPVMLPLSMDAATAKLIDPNLDYTLLWVWWDYLPLLAG